MWKQVIAEADPNVEFFPPATVEQIDWTEDTVKMCFPFSLRCLYLETNGLSGKQRRDFLTWRLDVLMERNAHFAEDEAVDSMLFFAHAGDEVAFGFPIKNARAVDKVAIYYPSTGELIQTELPLARFMVQWFNGQFDV